MRVDDLKDDPNGISKSYCATVNRLPEKRQSDAKNKSEGPWSYTGLAWIRERLES